MNDHGAPSAGLGPDELRAALRSDDVDRRVDAIVRAGEGPEVDGALIAAMSDPHPAVRRACVRALARSPRPPAIRAVIRACSGDPSVAVRAEAVLALGGALERQASEHARGPGQA